jgi:hypothetical protein
VVYEECYINDLFHWKQLINHTLFLRVRTHRQSRVEANQTRKDAAGTIWLDYNAHTLAESSRVESNPVESSPTSLAESRVLMPRVAFSSVGLQFPGLTVAVFRREMNVERSIVVTDQSICFSL